MTFLNPFYLVGVAAGIIPLLIHLLHRRRLKVVDFSSIEFLKKIEGRRTRWFRIREMLLLILRTLAVVMLALAISRPVLKSTVFGPLGTHARSSSVFILDNSYSMGATTKDGSSFTKAKAQANEILKLLDRGDEASLILASNISRPVFEGLVREPSLLKGAISQAKLSSRHTDYRPSLRMAMAMLDASRNLNKEVYLFTDMQRSGFESFSRGGIRGTAGKRLYIFDSAPKGQMNNVALLDLVLADPLLFEGGRVKCLATLRNYSGRRVDVSLLSRLDGREMGV
ncbi:MAG: BatA and WFA domain-containing protein, partial [bacterium]